MWRNIWPGVEGVSTENRIRILRLIENMTGGTALVESMHGAGSPQTQKVMYARIGQTRYEEEDGQETGGNRGRAFTGVNNRLWSSANGSRCRMRCARQSAWALPIHKTAH